MEHLEQHEDDRPIGPVAVMDWALRIVALLTGVGALTIFLFSLERVS